MVSAKISKSYFIRVVFWRFWVLNGKGLIYTRAAGLFSIILLFIVFGIWGVWKATHYNPVDLAYEGISGLLLGNASALLVSAICGAIMLGGAFIGILTGLYPFWTKVNLEVMRTINMFPKILCLILVNYSTNGNFVIITIVFALLFLPNISIPLNEKVTAIMKKKQYITMARLNGCSKMQLLREHIWGNCKYSFLTLVSQGISYALMIHFLTGFLKMGNTPDGWGNWGKMLYIANDDISGGKLLLPAASIMISVMSFNMLANIFRCIDREIK